MMLSVGRVDETGDYGNANSEGCFRPTRVHPRGPGRTIVTPQKVVVWQLLCQLWPGCETRGEEQRAKGAGHTRASEERRGSERERKTRATKRERPSQDTISTQRP